MGDVDDGGAEPLVQRLDLGAHLHAQLRVEVGERLVEQEHRRLAHDGAAHGDALALAAGKRCRATVEEGFQADHLGGRRDALHALRLGHAGDLQRIADVLGHRHVRIKRVVLEHHRDTTL